ncbi:MAG: hypothetical protein WC479_00415 [Candidatus Izemoplasmatales bacterium]|jgi:FtsZ-binding cell division protein ZapB
MESNTTTVSIIKEWIGIILLLVSLLSSGALWLKSRKMDKYTINKEKFQAKGEELTYTEKLEAILDELREDITKLQDEQKKTNQMQKKTEQTVVYLKCQIKNYQALINALVGQLQKANITPVKMEDVKVADCEELIIP